MDDVDYLVEDNVMDDLYLSSEMDGTHGRTTSEDDPEQQLLRRAVQGGLAQGGASWEQNANAGNDSGNWGKTKQSRVFPTFQWL